MPNLSGRIFVVTGGNGGIGLGMAEGIAASGGSIAIWARNEEKNKAAVQKLEKLGVTAKAYVCDVSSEETVVETMAGTVADFGRIDGLFANAGRPGTGTPFVDLTLTEWQKIMAVNWPWLKFRGKMGQRTSGESPPVKAALDLLGRNGGPSRLPSRTLNSDERNDLKELLIQIGVPFP